VRAKTVVVAHRQPIAAEGIAAALGRHAHIVPLAWTSDVKDAEDKAQNANAVVIDETLPGAARAAKTLRRRGVRVVFLSDTQDDDDVRVSPRAPMRSLAAALVPEAEPRLRPGFRGGRLTPRERDVLALVSRGLPAKEVARQLGISHKTVEIHKTRIFAKLGVANQAAAVSVAMGQEPAHPWSLPAANGLS
jgi:DNA-binding NarL/FixJ family response regulator